MSSQQLFTPAPTLSSRVELQTVQVPQPELELRDVFAGLVRRRMLILGGAVLGMLAGLLFALAHHKEFSATATVEFAQPSTRGLGIDATGSTTEELPTMDLLNTELKTEQAEISDDNTILSVIERLKLVSVAPFAIPANIPATDPLSRERGLPLDQAPYQRERVLRMFQRNLSVDVVKGTRLLSVTYRDTDPHRAAMIANTVVQAYMEQTTARRYTAVSQISSWLNDQLALLKQRVEDSQRTVEKYGSENEKDLAGLGVLSAGGSGHGPESYPAAESVPVARLLALNNDLTTAQVSRLAKEAIYRVTETGDTAAVLSLGNSPLVSGAGADSSVSTANQGLLLLQRLQEQQAELNVQMATAATKYGPKSATMLEYTRQHDAVDGQLHAEMGRIRARAKEDLDLALQAEGALRAQVSTQQRQVSQWTTKADRLLLLQGEAASNRSLYQGLYAKLQESQLATGIRTSRVGFIDAASVPTTPSTPRKRTALMTGLALGALLGLVGAFAIEYLDDALHSAEAVERLFGSRVLGSIPDFAKGAAPSTAWVAQEPQSRVAEAYRTFRATAFTQPDQGGAKVILAVSARPGEGKATTCLNTAAALGAQGHRVLILNADMRRSRPPAAWDERQDAGLSRFLQSPLGTHELVALPGVPGVSLLPAGSATPQAPELLSSLKFADLLTLLREEFEYILIDSPPAMLFTDAQVLAASADACVLIVRASETTRRDAEQVLAMLKNVHAPLLGVLFNGATLRDASYTKFGYQV